MAHTVAAFAHASASPVVKQGRTSFSAQTVHSRSPHQDTPPAATKSRGYVHRSHAGNGFHLTPTLISSAPIVSPEAPKRHDKASGDQVRPPRIRMLAQVAQAAIERGHTILSVQRRTDTYRRAVVPISGNLPGPSEEWRSPPELSSMAFPRLITN
jgi:hypothetical protein